MQMALNRKFSFIKNLSYCKRISLQSLLQKYSFSNKIQEEERKRQLMLKGLPKRQNIEGVGNVIVIASAKGGVGKSTTAVNLSLALSELNKKVGVGLLDMDVFGPSIPKMMNLYDNPDIDSEGNLVPLINYGVKCMSMGFLVKEKDAIVWRGPMVMSAVQRLLLNTSWGNLKYLILDLPPGTGDTQLSLSQLVNVNGAVIVSTPQDIALLDARRGVEMFKKVEIPVLGLIQNMSVFICPKCGHEEHIFGQDGARAMSEDVGVPLLGDVALNSIIRKGADSGQPVMITDPESLLSQNYLNIAKQIIENLSNKP